MKQSKISQLRQAYFLFTLFIICAILNIKLPKKVDNSRALQDSSLRSRQLTPIILSSDSVISNSQQLQFDTKKKTTTENRKTDIAKRERRRRSHEKRSLDNNAGGPSHQTEVQPENRVHHYIDDPIPSYPENGYRRSCRSRVFTNGGFSDNSTARVN